MPENSDDGKVRINGKIYAIPEDYKVKEYRMLTEMTGKSAVSEIDFTDPNAVAALALILLRRENPDFDEAELEEVSVGYVDEGDVDPPVDTTHRAGSGTPS